MIVGAVEVVIALASEATNVQNWFIASLAIIFQTKKTQKKAV
jgi:hypothetical protein